MIGERERRALIRELRPGDEITAEWLSSAARALNDAVRGAFAPRQVFPAGQTAAAANVRAATIASIQGDYLVCKFADGADQGEQLYVAKPPPFRVSFVSHAGVTFTSTSAIGATRDATDGSTSNSQVLTPSYQVNDTVMVIGPTFTGLTLADGVTAITWEDTNHWARNWAVQD